MTRMTLKTATETIAELEATVVELRAKLATFEPKAKAGLDQRAKFLKAGIASAIDAKVDGKRDWETLGKAINDFDAYMNPDLDTWEMDPFAWEALSPFARYLALTGHCKSGFKTGGSRRIDGLKIPSSTGKAYDQKREAFANRMSACDMTVMDTIVNGEGEAVRLSI